MTSESNPAPESAAETPPPPKPFVRGGRLFMYKLINPWLPPPPDNHVTLDFGEFKDKLEPRDYLLSLPMFATFITLLRFQMHLWSFTAWSPALVVVMGAVWVLKHIGSLARHIALYAYLSFVGLCVLLLIVLLVNRMIERKKIKREYLGMSHLERAEQPEEVVRIASTPWYRRVPKAAERAGVLTYAAVIEEQWFREGAENWSFKQRVLSCLGFALLHLENLIYPLATLLPLGVMGAVFMVVYLRAYRKTGNRASAVLRSSKLHRLYNRVALYGVVVNLAYSLAAGVHWVPSFW